MTDIEAPEVKTSEKIAAIMKEVKKKKNALERTDMTRLWAIVYTELEKIYALAVYTEDQPPF